MSGNKGCQSTVPKPIFEMLGRPARITFVVRGDEIVVARGPDDAPARRRRPKGGSPGGGKAGARRP